MLTMFFQCFKSCVTEFWLYKRFSVSSELTVCLHGICVIDAWKCLVSQCSPARKCVYSHAKLCTSLHPSAASMTALVVTACIIWCVCAAKSNRQKDGFHRLRQHRDDYEDEIRLTSMGSKKSLLAHEFQDESESDEETLYANKIWEVLH